MINNKNIKRVLETTSFGHQVLERNVSYSIFLLFLKMGIWCWRKQNSSLDVFHSPITDSSLYQAQLSSFYFGVLHPVVRALSRLWEEPSLATTVQGVYLYLSRNKHLKQLLRKTVLPIILIPAEWDSFCHYAWCLKQFQFPKCCVKKNYLVDSVQNSSCV
jgi:hypothetical protein